MNKQFWLDSLYATIFIFILMWSIFNISQLAIFDAFNPIGDALEDMEITDIAFSQLRDDPEPDTNVVIVNIGLLSRSEIARQIEIINKYEPKVIGIDAFFKDLKPDTLGDLVLSNALSNVENLVMVSKILQSTSLQETHIGEEVYDSLKLSHPLFMTNAHTGFANLDTDAENQEDFKTCRNFPTFRTVNGEQQRAFALEMVRLYNPEKAEKLIARGNEYEAINYRGNIVDFFGRTGYPNMFYALDAEDVLSENFIPEIIRGKIVVFGYMGSDFFDTSWDDKFFTPLNKKYAGKANPDMYGVVVHANITSMILNEDYIDELSDKEFGGFILAFIFCFLNIALFSYIYRALPRWYDGITKLAQLVELLIILFLMVKIFSEYSFKLNLVITLAAIALSGDALEVYYGVVKNLFSKERRRQLFTIVRKNV